MRFEMGSTPADFHQRLPAIATVNYDAANMEFSHLEEDGRCWSLRLIRPRQRTLGSLDLPVVDVELTFQNYAQADIDAFMVRFHSHFRRGGG